MKSGASFKGYVPAILSAITYGMNPLFGILLYRDGLTPLSVLFYRFFFASILLAGVVVLRKKEFRIPRTHIWFMAAEGTLLALTCLLWFISFKIMDSGVAAAILFSYPVMVAVIMCAVYHEKLTLSTGIGIVLATAGVAVLCRMDGTSKVSVTGIVCILASALAYAVYIVFLKKSRLSTLAPETLTFRGMAIGSVLVLLCLRGGADLQPIPGWRAFGNIMGLAFFPSLLAFLLMAMAVRQIGATKTAVLGALEPMTAVVIGISVFHEPFTWSLALGMVMIIASVCVIVLSQNKPSTGENK